MKKRLIKWSAALVMTIALITGYHKQAEAYPAQSCASLNQQYWIYIPDDAFCAVFYSCDYDWNYTRHECDWPLHFNPQLQVCDWPPTGDNAPWPPPCI